MRNDPFKLNDKKEEKDDNNPTRKKQKQFFFGISAFHHFPIMGKMKTHPAVVACKLMRI